MMNLTGFFRVTKTKKSNNGYVKTLYGKLRKFKGRKSFKAENYESIIIGSSDVPIRGYYD